ncbi:RNase adapter RapZ [Sinirhodobacter populi]|uniref:RNase adapter RapZ n=1 Tax=Paenirhodobacter populi TaxID=2306993 RepID=A0A443J1L8_9RHOB|nr:RNase adapter RapZ [Sinirhodobacter populi]
MAQGWESRVTSETVQGNAGNPGVQTRVVLVMGPSGSGRTTAIAALEDFGYETIHNLPLSLVPRLIDGPLDRPVALGLDVRNRDFSVARMIELIDRLTHNPALKLELLYLDTQPDVLVRRYSETRRRHPLAPADAPLEGIRQEVDLLAPIRARADVLIDTSAMTPHDLRAEVGRWFDMGHVARLVVSIHSFSYKRGAPRGLDMMFDCRFLSNPYWIPALRPLTGLSPEVADYVASDPRYREFIAKVKDLLLFLLPAHVAEGKSHLSIGFGCTGGQHRSVAVTETIAKTLAEAGWQVSKRHRELERQAQTLPEVRTGSGA